MWQMTRSRARASLITAKTNLKPITRLRSWKKSTRSSKTCSICKEMRVRAPQLQRIRQLQLPKALQQVSCAKILIRSKMDRSQNQNRQIALMCESYSLMVVSKTTIINNSSNKRAERLSLRKEIDSMRHHSQRLSHLCQGNKFRSTSIKA